MQPQLQSPRSACACCRLHRAACQRPSGWALRQHEKQQRQEASRGGLLLGDAIQQTEAPASVAAAAGRTSPPASAAH